MDAAHSTESSGDEQVGREPSVVVSHGGPEAELQGEDLSDGPQTEASRDVTEALRKTRGWRQKLTARTTRYIFTQSYFFNIIGGESHELTPNAQIWPRALNAMIGGDPTSIYLIMADVRNALFTLEMTNS